MQNIIDKIDDMEMPPDFTLRQLAYFVAAAETGTIAEAASRLHVSPSAMSDAISELERVLDARLCVRRRAHGLSLTSAGTQVLTQARELLRLSDELGHSLRGDTGELVGPITIGCYPTLAPTILPPLLDDFGTQHPRLDLQILEATHDQLEGRLESGEVDVAFVYDLLIPGRPRREKIFEIAPHVLVAADDPLAGRTSVRLAELVDRDLILLDAPPSKEHTLSLFDARGLTPRVRHRAESYEAVRTLVGRGLGYGILVQRPANPASYEGYPLVMLEIDPPGDPAVIDVIWSSTTEPPARVRALIEFARRISWT